MALIKNLEILLSARTGKLDTDLNKALGSLRSFSSRVGGLIAAVGGTLSLATVVANVRRQYERIDDLAKKSSALGILVSDLQSLELSAGLAGVSMDRLITSTSRLLRNIGDASAGLGEAKRAFDALRIDPVALSKLSLPDQLDSIAEAFSKLTNDTQRAYVALQLFGRSGLAIIPFLKDRSIKDAARFIKEYQLGISQVDSKLVERANDTWDMLRTVVGDLATKVAVSLAPAFIWLGEALTRAFRPGTLLHGALQAFGAIVGSVIKVVLVLASGLSALAGLQASVAGRFLGAIAAFIGFIAVLRFTIVTVRLLVGALAQLRNMQIVTQALAGPAGWKKLGLAAGIVLTTMLAINEAIRKAEGDMKQFGETTDSALNKLGGMNIRPPQAINVGTARAGSQEAIAQLFTIKVQGPVVSELQQVNETLDGILNAVQDNPAIAGGDEEFTL